MVTIVGTTKDADGNIKSIVDTNTAESIARWQPCLLEDDFVGAGHTVALLPAGGAPVVGYPWVAKIVGAAPPTVAIVSNVAGGVMASTLTAASQKQDATLYGNDQLTWDATKSLFFESRFAMSVLPTALVEMVVGLQSAWIDGPDNASFYLRFQALASGLINCQSKDGVNTTSVSSGVTLVAGVYHLFRIDASVLTDVAFYIDGARVNAVGSISFAATGANALLQMYASAYKASGTGIGTLYLDTMSVGMDRV